jgi:hypothetical protein
VWALPIAWRLDGAPFLVRYALAAAACIVIAGPLVFALRAGSTRAGGSEVAAVWAAALLAGPFALLGTILKVQTHHRQLGGVTFAVLAALAVIGLALILGRARQIARARGRSRALVAVLAVIAGVSIAVCVPRLARVPEPFGVGILLELAIGLPVILLAARLRYALPGSVARVAAWAWIAIAAAGVFGARAAPEASRAVASGAPLTFGLTIGPQ